MDRTTNKNFSMDMLKLFNLVTETPPENYKKLCDLVSAGLKKYPADPYNRTLIGAWCGLIDNCLLNSGHTCKENKFKCAACDHLPPPCK